MTSKRDFLHAQRTGTPVATRNTYMEFRNRQRRPVSAGLQYFRADGSLVLEYFDHYYEAVARLDELGREGIEFYVEG